MRRPARPTCPQPPSSPVHQPSEGLLARGRLHQGRSNRVLPEHRPLDPPYLPTVRWCSPVFPTGSRASRSSRRTPAASFPSGSAPSGCGASRRNEKSTTSSVTTKLRCSTSSTWEPSRCTSGPVGRESRASGLVRARSRPQGRAVHRRGHGSLRSRTQLCEEIGLPNLVKTSGSSGLHVLIPLGCQCRYEEARTLGELLARVICRPSCPTSRP